LYSRSSKLAAYQSAGTHGGVAAADPHGLVLLLLNGALERIARARGCIANQVYSEKAQLIHRTVAIVDELRNSLNLQNGGDLAKNLDRLYDYVCRQLLHASMQNDVKALEEAGRLLQQVRDGWDSIPKAQRSVEAVKP
jgi:flagellar protein FliS